MVSKGTARKLMIPTTFMTVLIGAIILGFGAWTLVRLETHPYGTSGYPLLLASMMIGVGGIITLLASVVGFLANTNPTGKLINYYFFLMFILVVSQIILVSINYKWKPDAVYDIKTALQKYLETYNPEADSNDIWNEFQRSKKCCGVKGMFNNALVGQKANANELLEIPDKKYSTKEIWNRGQDLDNKTYHEQKYHEEYCVFEKEKPYRFIGPDKKYEEPCTQEYKIQKETLHRGYENWETATTWQEIVREKKGSTTSVPNSCCRIEANDCGLFQTGTPKNERLSKIYTQGCYKVYYKEVKQDIAIGHLGGLVLFILELVFCAVICTLLKKIDPPKHH